MKCSQCRTRLRSKKAFCHRCGARIDVQSPTYSFRLPRWIHTSGFHHEIYIGTVSILLALACGLLVYLTWKSAQVPSIFSVLPAEQTILGFEGDFRAVKQDMIYARDLLRPSENLSFSSWRSRIETLTHAMQLDYASDLEYAFRPHLGAALLQMESQPAWVYFLAIRNAQLVRSALGRIPTNTNHQASFVASDSEFPSFSVEGTVYYYALGSEYLMLSPVQDALRMMKNTPNPLTTKASFRFASEHIPMNGMLRMYANSQTLLLNIDLSDIIDSSFKRQFLQSLLGSQQDIWGNLTADRTGFMFDYTMFNPKSDHLWPVTSPLAHHLLLESALSHHIDDLEVVWSGNDLHSKLSLLLSNLSASNYLFAVPLLTLQKTLETGYGLPISSSLLPLLRGEYLIAANPSNSQWVILFDFSESPEQQDQFLQGISSVFQSLAPYGNPVRRDYQLIDGTPASEWVINPEIKANYTERTLAQGVLKTWAIPQSDTRLSTLTQGDHLYLSADPEFLQSITVPSEDLDSTSNVAHLKVSDEVTVIQLRKILLGLLLHPKPSTSDTNRLSSWIKPYASSLSDLTAIFSGLSVTMEGVQGSLYLPLQIQK